MDKLQEMGVKIAGFGLKQLIEFPFKNEGSILVEVDEPQPEGGVAPAARAEEIIAKAE